MPMRHNPSPRTASVRDHSLQLPVGTSAPTPVGLGASVYRAQPGMASAPIIDRNGVEFADPAGQLSWNLSFHGSPNWVAEANTTLRGLSHDLPYGYPHERLPGGVSLVAEHQLSRLAVRDVDHQGPLEVAGEQVADLVYDHEHLSVQRISDSDAFQIVYL